MLAITTGALLLVAAVDPSANRQVVAQQQTGCRSFKETGRSVCGKFLQYWNTHGAIEVLGYPISDEFVEKSDLNGKSYTVQYFERAELELHPENRPPYDVLQAQLGTLAFRQKYPNGVGASSGGTGSSIQTVFVIAMENHNWSQIAGNSSAPYINDVLLPQASYAKQYYNPPGIHPSEPNYLWLEAGTGFGISNDSDPASNHLKTSAHLTTLLDRKGISWKAYVEGISGTECPLTSGGLYAAKHNPMVFFDNVTDVNNPSSTYCISHERSYTELGSDLQQGTTAQYNFVVPNLCDDMHNSFGCASLNSVRNGDNWLSVEVPKILASSVYENGGALFIVWDEGSGGDGPIGMIVLSPSARGGGYSNTIHYTHSSLLRTVEEVFGVTPLLGDAANANDLSDLFRAFP